MTGEYPRAAYNPHTGRLMVDRMAFTKELRHARKQIKPQIKVY